MNKLLVIMLLSALLCGCAAAGVAPQMGVASTPASTKQQGTSQGPGVTIPATIGKNPGLTVDPYDPDNQVPALMETKIRQDYCAHHSNIAIEDVRLRFMGIFDDVYAMFVDVKGMMYAEVINTENVGGFQFVYSCSQHMQIWHEGEFYTLPLAYEAGLLTAENLRQLSADYYAAHPYLWQYVAVPE